MKELFLHIYVCLLLEAERASQELLNLGINNQIMIMNGVLEKFDDDISKKLYNKQQIAIQNMPNSLREKETFIIPLRAYNITGIENVRNFLIKDKFCGYCLEC